LLCLLDYIKPLGLLPMIEPYSEGVQGGGVIGFGLTHAGYDMRLGPTLLVFKNTWNEVINPKKFRDESYRRRVFDEVQAAEGGAFCIPPHSYALGNSLEYLRIPNWLKGRVVGKSTPARCGIIINCTPLEPGWEGHLTIEISNTSPCPVLVFSGEGIAQLEFEQLSDAPEQDYSQKGEAGGKYNFQGPEPVPARVVE
jgi:dCTP deaminase